MTDIGSKVEIVYNIWMDGILVVFDMCDVWRIKNL